MNIKSKNRNAILLTFYTNRGIVLYSINDFNSNKVDVNEDNIIALNFYKKIGFRVYSISEFDDFVNNFPIFSYKNIVYIYVSKFYNFLSLCIAFFFHNVRIIKLLVRYI